MVIATLDGKSELGLLSYPDGSARAVVIDGLRDAGPPAEGEPVRLVVPVYQLRALIQRLEKAMKDAR